MTTVTHRLTWVEGRTTAEVTKVGEERKRTKGKRVIATRLATEEEEAQIERGEWVRTRVPQGDTSPEERERLRRQRVAPTEGAMAPSEPE